MCEAEDRLRKLAKWLQKNHLEVWIEYQKLTLEELRKKVFE